MSNKVDFAEERSASEASDGRKAQEFDRHRTQGNILFVGNLPFQTPWQHIKDQFRQAGKVRYTDLIADRNGRPKGSALVTMQSPDGARRAIRLFNESEFEGRRLIVRLFDDGPRPQLVQRDLMPQYNRRREGGSHGNAGGNNNHGNNNNNSNQAGNNNQSRRPQTQQRDQPSSASQGTKSQQRNNNNNNNDDVGLPKPRSQQVSEADRKLFVSNLPFDCTAVALRETFQQIGGVDRAEIIVGRSGKSRGMGIVVMTSSEEARVAISEFDGIEMAGRAMNVRFDQKA